MNKLAETNREQMNVVKVQMITENREIIRLNLEIINKIVVWSNS